MNLSKCLNSDLFDSINVKDNFTLFKPLNVVEDELVHSRIIKYILSNKYTGVSGLKKFFQILNKEKELPFNLSTNFNRKKIVVVRERFNLDILIKNMDNRQIIAIENKINADESNDQISTYQNKLKSKFKKLDRMILFLTPSGKDSSTADDEHSTSCINIGYKLIIELIENVQKELDKDSNYNRFLDLFKKHLEENIMTNKDLKEEINRLWGNPETRSKLNKIINERPDLTEMSDYYISLIKKHMNKYNDSPYVSFYPQKTPREVKIRSKKLLDNEIGIVIMLYDNYTKNIYPKLRVMIPTKNANKSIYKEVKNILEEKNMPVNMNKINGWSYWTNLLGDSDIPEKVFKKSHKYGNNFAEIVFNEFKKYYSEIHVPLIENMCN